ncbi:MAG: hypothetical protein M3O46_17100 [Myxococcota bacterium]|nr:hypothetical protein [Myxococcota bacterium]
MASLRSAINELAGTFATSVLSAIRAASLQELLGEAGGTAPRPRGRPRGVPGGSGNLGQAKRTPRLKRRSPADIAKALDQVVTLLKSKKEGLRAEQIRKTLRMQSKEMPRVLSDGLAQKRLKKKGQKRATTYSAA